MHFSRVWPQSKIPSECISLNGIKLFWIMHAMNGLLKRSPTFDVTVGLKQNTRNSVIGLERLKFTSILNSQFSIPILHSPFSILYSPFSILNSQFSILYSPFSNLHSPFSILYSPFSILHSPFSILNS